MCVAPFSGCLSSFRSEEEPRWETEFTVTEIGCLGGEEDYERVNEATVERDEGTVIATGTISDGEPERTAELRDVTIEDSTLYVAINTIARDSATDCPQVFDYRAVVDLVHDIELVDEYVVFHNGKRV